MLLNFCAFLPTFVLAARARLFLEYCLRGRDGAVIGDGTAL
jgi:hypothetical protein